MKKHNFCAILLIVLISLCSAFSLAGCGEKDPIVGKWYEIDKYNQKTDELVYTFSQNGTLKVNSNGKQWTWEYDTESKTYKIYFDENDSSRFWTFILNEDKQEMTSSNGYAFYKK